MVLTESERETINSGSSHQERYAIFQRIWSAKEAVAKAIGQGLSFGLERMEVTLPDLPQEEGLGGFVLSAIGLSRSDEREAKRGRMSFSPAEGKEPRHRARTRKVDVHIDHWPRADWRVYQEELVGGAWASVALGPVGEVVDADGHFRTTFRLPRLGGPASVEELAAQARKEESARWLSEAQGFQMLDIDTLLPEEAKHRLSELRVRSLAQ
ncbi:unnamed protein product [Effrenium voratum]|nr:unnamed protein product [Effrenium voratum]